MPAPGRCPLRTAWWISIAWRAAGQRPAGLRLPAARPGRFAGHLRRPRPTQIQAFCHRWLDALPTPLSGADEVAGYWWELSMRQIETSRTNVFDALAMPFFEALVADNLDLGRPDTVELVSDRRIVTGPKRATPGVFKTEVVTRGVDVTVNAFYRHSRLKQYLSATRKVHVVSGRAVWK
jgi:hypothetical protein